MNGAGGIHGGSFRSCGCSILLSRKQLRMLPCREKSRRIQPQCRKRKRRDQKMADGRTDKLDEAIAILQKIWEGMQKREAGDLLDTPMFIATPSYHIPGEMVIGGHWSWTPAILSEETSTDPQPADP